MPIPSGVDKKKSKVYIEKGAGTENYIQILPESFCEEGFVADSFWPVSSHFLKQYTDTVEERIAPFNGATASAAGKIGTVPQAEIGDRASFLRGDGKWAKINITDEKVKFNLNRTKRYYLSGTDVADANTGQATFDTGVFVTENPGELQATKFLGNLKGNVEGNLNGLAERASKDADGHVFTDYYVTNSTLAANYAPLNHKHPSSDVNALTNYAKGNSTEAISAGDTLNQALGKLEKRADLSATLNSPAFTGTPTTPNLSSGSLDTQIANKKYVDDKVSALVNGAGAALDTLSELANALGNDANFATTVTNKFNTKLDKNSANYVKSISISDNTTGSGQILKMQRGDDTTYTLNIKDTIIQPATAAPLAAQAQAKVGTSLKYAREDHVHPLQDTTVANATNAVAAQHADKLTTPRNLRANLAATDPAPFDGTVNQLNIPVAGILKVENGGTGASNLNGLVQTGNVNQTIAGTKTFSSTIAGSINGNAATATTATKVQATPAGTSWVAGVQAGKALVNATTTGYGALLNAPTKDYRVGLSTYPSNNNLVYLYSVTNANVSAGTNTVAKSLTWNADTGELTANSFKGNLTGTATACSGNAASATKATQDGDGKVISTTYVKNTGGTITGTLDLTRTTDAQGTGTNAPALRIGALTGAHLEFDGNEIMAKASGNTVGPLYINSDGGLVSIGSGGLTVGGTITGNLKGNVTGNCSGSSSSCTGNAGSATKLATARNFYIADNSSTNTGPATSFNGTANATIKLPATIKANITGNCSGSSGSCTGNAKTATTATKLGSATVGSATKLMYLNAGAPTASTSNVGGAQQLTYLKSGVITAGATIRYGTGNPSGGNNGDIYFKYTK